MNTGDAIFFAVVLGLGVALIVMALRWKPMNWMISFLGITYWLGITFWWNINSPFAAFTSFTFPDIFIDVLKYLPFLFMIGIIADAVNRWGQVEISREVGGRRFTETGTPPKSSKSGYDDYKEQLLGRVHKGRR